MSDQRLNQALGLSVPKGEAIATFETYPEAQALVDHLAKAEFDVSKVSIVGNDLKTVERVTGKLSYGRAALQGAANGAFIGVFFVLLVTLFTPELNFRLLAAAVLIATGIGVGLSLASYAITRRRRDFASTQQVLASNYQVIVPAEFAEAAKVAAGQQPTNPAQPF